MHWVQCKVRNSTKSTAIVFAKIAKDQILKALASTLNSLKFCASLKNGTMTSNLVKGKHLCMEQFKSLFGLCRIPKEGEGDKDVVDEDS